MLEPEVLAFASNVLASKDQILLLLDRLSNIRTKASEKSCRIGKCEHRPSPQQETAYLSAAYLPRLIAAIPFPSPNS